MVHGNRKSALLHALFVLYVRKAVYHFLPRRNSDMYVRTLFLYLSGPRADFPFVFFASWVVWLRTQPCLLPQSSIFIATPSLPFPPAPPRPNWKTLNYGEPITRHRGEKTAKGFIFLAEEKYVSSLFYLPVTKKVNTPCGNPQVARTKKTISARHTRVSTQDSCELYYQKIPPTFMKDDGLRTNLGFHCLNNPLQVRSGHQSSPE